MSPLRAVTDDWITEQKKAQLAAWQREFDGYQQQPVYPVEENLMGLHSFCPFCELPTTLVLVADPKQVLGPFAVGGTVHVYDPQAEQQLARRRALSPHQCEQHRDVRVPAWRAARRADCPRCPACPGEPCRYVPGRARDLLPGSFHYARWPHDHRGDWGTYKSGLDH